MINVNELRIGNLLTKSLTSGNGKTILDKVAPNDIGRIYDGISLFKYEPIPITEEWIKKFNVLEIRDKTWRFNNYVIEHWYNMYLIKYISMTNQLIQIGTEIKYVHQFQNIAFALTQIELELK